MTYKKVVISEFGDADVLKLVEEAIPEPQKGEVRIKISKVSANFTDVMIRKGKYPEVKEKPPFALGYDMVGKVDKLGEGVSKFIIGQKVADMTVIGSYAEYICLDEDRLTLVPEEVNNSDAATLILSYMTAYQMLHRVAKISKGQSILIHGASGAVGIALLQLGQLLGLKMYGTASKAKHEIVIKNGGIPIDYNTEDFVERIETLTKEGVDAAFDAIGGENFKRSFASLRPGGILVAYGFYNAVMGKGGNIPLEFMKVMLWNILPNKRKTSFYIISQMRKKHPEWFKEDLSQLLQLLKKGDINPEISNHYTLDQAAHVHTLIENAELKGKAIFDIG